MTRTRWIAGVLGVLTVALSGCVGSMQTSPDDVKGAGGLVPKDKDKDAGLVAVAPGFDIKAYRVVAVERFVVTDPKVKDDGDRRTAYAMSAFLQGELSRRLRESGLFVRVVNAGDTEFRAGSEPTLKLQGEITRLGEGSQAARYFAGGYGAGRTRAQAEMHLVDARSGRVVLAIADRRVASQGGAFGGSSKDYLRESFDDMARDVGRFLVRLARGEAPAN
ncbi:MAG TPA: DUF4410 domain-containing protein [Methylomirabilota bacterium]